MSKNKKKTSIKKKGANSCHGNIILTNMIYLWGDATPLGLRSTCLGCWKYPCSQIMGKEKVLCFCNRKIFWNAPGADDGRCFMIFPFFFRGKVFQGAKIQSRCVHLVKNDSTAVCVQDIWFLSSQTSEFIEAKRRLSHVIPDLFGDHCILIYPCCSSIYDMSTFLSHPQLLWNTKKRIWIMWDVMHVTRVWHDSNPFGVSRHLGMVMTWSFLHAMQLCMLCDANSSLKGRNPLAVHPTRPRLWCDPSSFSKPPSFRIEWIDWSV